MTEPSPNKKSLALVIGSGSVKCAAAVGVMQVLERERIPLDLIVGCSGGAIYAACIALGYSVAAMAQMTNELWTSDVMAGYASNLKAVMTGAMEFDERAGIVDDAGMLAQYTRVFGDKQFSDARVPLYITATDLRNGEKVVLTRGKLLDAVRASSAMPMIYRPWEIDGRLLTDGAASDPLPVDVAIQEGAHIILALGFELPYRARLRSFNAVQNQYNSIFMNNLLRSAYAFHNLAHHAEIITMLPDVPVAGFDTQQFPRIIEAGARAAEDHVAYLRRLLAATTT